MQNGYDHTVDWWALGILLFHFLSGVTPFMDESKVFLLIYFFFILIFSIFSSSFLFLLIRKYNLFFSSIFSVCLNLVLDIRSEVWKIL